ncbi:hypothetical protein MC885_002834 [Smutsia gigantea]|nr:hypothetical protein MC885_002834 [Smutsia gigantea]
MGLPRRAGDPAELRKSLKPLLEKRRRARINASLRQLKALILPLLGREELPASSCPAEAPTPSDSYRDGYRACLARLARRPRPCPLPRHLPRAAAPASGVPGSSLARPRTLLTDLERWANEEALGAAAALPTRNQPSARSQGGIRMFLIFVAD